MVVDPTFDIESKSASKQKSVGTGEASGEISWGTKIFDEIFLLHGVSE